MDKTAVLEELKDGNSMETLAERWLAASLKVSDCLTEVVKKFN